MVDANELTLQKRLANNLASRRKSLAWTQDLLAQKLGVDAETISRFERGITVPSLKSIEQLASALSMTISDLLG